MTARIVTLARPHPGDETLREIAAVVKGGGVIVYPTDTIYGLGCDPFNHEAVERIFRIKRRPADNPALLLIADETMLKELVREVPPSARRLIDRHWPGPLTLVFDARRSIHPFITPQLDQSIAVRRPANEFCLRLLQTCGVPLVSTSANLTGRKPPAEIGQLKSLFSASTDLIVDAGDLPPSLPSTIVDVRRGKVAVIREGAITAGKIQEVLDEKGGEASQK